MFFRNDLCFKF